MALALSLGLALAGCGRDAPGTAAEPTEPPAPSVAPGLPAVTPQPTAELGVLDLTPPELRPEGVAEALDGIMVAAFFDAATFARPAEGAEPTCNGGIVVGYALLQNHKPDPHAEAGEARAVVEGEVVCDAPGDRDGERDTFRADRVEVRPFGQPDAPSGRAELERVLDAAARAVATSLRGQVVMRRATDEAILATLAEGDDDGLLAEAAAQAGERRLAGAADHLARLANGPHDHAALRAGAALGLLRVDDEEVIRALVRMTDGPNEERHLVAIHALSDIGGPRAARYLDNLATSHPNPSLRELAREALRRVRDADE